MKKMLVVLLFIFSAVPAFAAEHNISINQAYEIPGRYALGFVLDTPETITEESVRSVMENCGKTWGVPMLQIAFYAPGVKQGQGPFLVGNTLDGKKIVILRSKTQEQALFFEKALGYVANTTDLTRPYAENEVVADDDFKGKRIIIEGVVPEVSKSFGKASIFFPEKKYALTGVQCYFALQDPALRKIKAGSTIRVSGVVKGYLMKRVVLEPCTIISIDNQLVY